MSTTSSSQRNVIESWLAGSVSAGLLHINTSKESCFCTHSIPITPPPSSKDRTVPTNHPNPKSSLSTTVDMEQFDDGSSASFSASAFDPATRPILSPRAPSSRKGYSSRSPSPTRKLLGQLEQATLPIKCCQPGSSGVTQPGEVADLRKLLSKDIRSSAIPDILENDLRTVDPEGYEDIPAHAFETCGNDSAAKELWQAIHSVYTEAERCHNHRKDESAWVEVVRSVLKLSGFGSTEGQFEINSMQTQTIEPSFLPSLPTTSLAVAKKADLAIAFSPYDRDVGPAIQSYLNRNPGSTLSQMQDAYTSSIPLICGLEVKQAGGDSNEGLTQLAIWTTAGLEKVDQLQRRNAPRRSGIMQPIVGMVVVGHTWEFYIVWREENGRRVVQGPHAALACGTGSYYDIFVLYKVMSRLRAWLSQKYWPWYRDEILNAVNM